ncbi:ferredoxin-type protein NapG [Neiella marina]|uniref:Ferredoxin-type protein NapG n=1 Tax=Neiella holothuriorum TaxID=2870530 RepID=A0ABS7EF55_9GAMM|nr:ferredoxin-type protein NapG [Neiella holothuriorum]MBW8190968.1 ferredoxin-type protein NapG [Neiella holothuriorum]
MGKGSISLTRRQFLHNSAKGACVAGVTVSGLALVSGSSGASGAQALRPPGALAEAEFMAACVRCGLCVEACPYDTLKLATLFEPAPMGTPYFDARAVPCEMCDDIPCQVACPSGAISPELASIDDARMGLAVLIDQETCLNWQGLRCDVCYRVCPLIDEAITLEAQRNTRTGHHAMFIPTVHSDACTGCGKCEQACVLETSAIKVLPRDVAKGELGKHYRWGWVEKDKAGHSLLEQDVLDLPDRRPEGG